MYCNICNKYRKFKNIIQFCQKIKSFYYSQCGHRYEKIFKEESIEILKIIGLTNNIDEYQKQYSHA